MEKKELKKVDIYKDYFLWCMISTLKSEIYNMATYIRKVTPYGTEYKTASKGFDKFLKNLGELEDKLAICTEVEGYLGLDN